MKKLSLICLWTLTCFKETISLPVNGDSRVIFVPISYGPSNVQTRGPLEMIGNWFQGTGFLPIEINVPNVFSSIGNTVGGWASNVGNFAQNVGTSVQGLTQNVGNGIQTFALGLTQRIPILGAIVRPNGTTQRFVVLVPAQNFAESDKMGQIGTSGLNDNPDVLEFFP